MLSPFPGMDPYLEAHWRDVHQRLIIYACDQIQPGLPGNLRARVEERVFVETPSGHSRSIHPDIRVIEYPRGRSERSAVAVIDSELSAAESVFVHFPDEEVTESYIEIRDAATGNQVITVIEFLSITNKQPGAGLDLYQRKRDELCGAKVSLVEIDLIRSGDRSSLMPITSIPEELRTTYQATVRRGWECPSIEVCAIPLRKRLPGIKIPLREGESEALLDLQPLIEQCYRNGGYDDIDYSVEPVPPLEPSDVVWADALLREKSFRTT